MKLENIILFLLLLTSTYYIYDKYKGKNTSRGIIIQESNPIKIESKKNSIQKSSYVPSFEDDDYDNDDDKNSSEEINKKSINSPREENNKNDDDDDDDDYDDDDLFL